jgi:Domain of unknown function (DUF5666)
MSFAGARARRTAGLAGLPLLWAAMLLPAALFAQVAHQPPPKPLAQVLGTVTEVDPANKSFTVKEDKTGAEYTVSTTATRRFLKVPPGEKDLKRAQPMEASQIAVGDRLLARGEKDASAPKLDAVIMIVMTAGELQQKHESELADWQKRGNRGTVNSVDPGTKQITITLRGPEGPKQVSVLTTPETQFSQYAPDSVKYSEAKLSSFAEVKPGDQLRVLGNLNADGTQITAERVVFGSFSTIAATVKSVAPDGKELQAVNLQTKQPITVKLTDDSTVRRLPPMMAAMLARRLNPGSGGGQSGNPGPRPGGAPQEASGAGMSAPPDGAASAGMKAGPGAGPGGARTNGDVSQLLERVPKISVSELKPGEAVVISGGAGDNPSQLTAINIISGVEPLFASAPTNAGRSNALGMWNLDIGTPGEQ